MINVRPIPPSTECDIRSVYSVSNCVLKGLFKPKDAWALFELPGHNKFGIRIADLCDYDFNVYEGLTKTSNFPLIPKALYERMRSFAELNTMMRGV